MKRQTKILAAILAVLLCALSLTACTSRHCKVCHDHGVINGPLCHVCQRSR